MYRRLSTYLLMGWIFLCIFSTLKSMENISENFEIHNNEEINELCLIIKKFPEKGFAKLDELTQKEILNNHLTNKKLFNTVIESYEKSDKKTDLLIETIFNKNIELNNRNIFKGMHFKRIESFINKTNNKHKKENLKKILEKTKKNFENISDNEKYKETPTLREFWQGFWQYRQEELYIFLKKNPKWAELLHDEHGYAPLHASIKNSDHTEADYKLIRLLVMLTSYYLFKEDKNGWTPIDYANSFVEHHQEIKNNISFALLNITPGEQVLADFDQAMKDKNFILMHELIQKNPEIIKHRDIYCLLQESERNIEQDKNKNQYKKNEQDKARESLKKIIEILDSDQKNIICDENITSDIRSKKSTSGNMISRDNQEIVNTKNDNTKYNKPIEKKISLYNIGRRLSVLFSKNKKKNDIKKN